MKSTQEHTKLATSDNILNKIKSFKNLRRILRVNYIYWRMQLLVAKWPPKNIKLYHLYQDLLLIFWETEFHFWRVNLKDAVIEYLKKHLVSSDLNNWQTKCSKCNLDAALNNKLIYHNKSDEPAGNRDIIAPSEAKRSLSQDIQCWMCLSKDHHAKLNNFLSGTSEIILQNIGDIIKSKPDCLIAQTGTNDLTNRTNFLNLAKKIVNTFFSL